MRELLLGYLLGGLNKSEQASVEERVQRDLRFREELECLAVGFRPSPVDRGMFPAPAGLAQQTIELVAKHVDQEQMNLVRRQTSNCRQGRTLTRCWSLADMVVAGGVAVAMALLFFPTIANSRFRSGLTGSQNHSRMLHLPVTSDDNVSHGYVPQPPARRHLAFADFDAPIHQQAGCVQHPELFLHPASNSSEPPQPVQVVRVRTMTGQQRTGVNEQVEKPGRWIRLHVGRQSE